MLHNIKFVQLQSFVCVISLYHIMNCCTFVYILYLYISITRTVECDYMCVMCIFCNDIKKGIVIRVLKVLFQGLPMCVIDCLPLMPFRSILKGSQDSYNICSCLIIYFVSGNCSLLMPNAANSIPLNLITIPPFSSSLDSKINKSSVTEV